MVLMSKNAIRPAIRTASDGIACEIARRSLAPRAAQREAQYADEVRRLLDAGLAVMRTNGTASSPRVADIVAAAGLSNDAFYRHFASKEALMAAILEDGSVRLASYLDHQMAKEPMPAAQVRAWVEGVMAQAAEDAVETTRAVLWNGGALSERAGDHRPSPVPLLAAGLIEPFAALGSVDPDADATLVAHAAVGMLSDYLWRRAHPTPAEVDHLVEFCLAAVTDRS